MDKIPTVKDVALRAGVSVGTVSRVLAGEAAVKAALREKVNEAIHALGYRPNVMARALRTSRTDVIGLIVPDITNPFFAQMAASAERAALEHRHSLMLASSHNDHEAEQSHIAAFLDRSVRGIIVVAANVSHPARVTSKVPIVSLDRRFADFPLISINHAEAAALVADHLYELGHRRIAYIAVPPIPRPDGRGARALSIASARWMPGSNWRSFPAASTTNRARSSAGGFCRNPASGVRRPLPPAATSRPLASCAPRAIWGSTCPESFRLPVSTISISPISSCRA